MQTIITRYDDMRIDRLLIKEYQKQLKNDLKTISGLNDIDLLLKGFESTFAEYIGSRYSFAVNSGTDALQLSLSVLGIKKGDTVIIPDITYPAVPLSIIYAGAEPIIVDVRKDDLQIDEKQLGKRIKKNTKAIIAVHMFARPCGIEAILDFARRKGLRVIEDCCQAESSEFKGRKLGFFWIFLVSPFNITSLFLLAGEAEVWCASMIKALKRSLIIPRFGMIRMCYWRLGKDFRV